MDDNELFERKWDEYTAIEEKKARKNKAQYLQRFFEIAPLFKIKTVLDAGCGNGVCLKMLHERGFVVTGVDLVIDHAIKKTKNLNNVKVLCGNVEWLEFSDNSFDAVVCLGVVHHTDGSKTIEELKRVAKKIVCVGVYGNRSACFRFAEVCLRKTLSLVPYGWNNFILKRLGYKTFDRIQRLEHIYVKRADRYSEKRLAQMFGGEWYCIMHRVRNWIDCVAIRKGKEAGK